MSKQSMATVWFWFVLVGMTVADIWIAYRAIPQIAELYLQFCVGIAIASSWMATVRVMVEDRYGMDRDVADSSEELLRIDDILDRVGAPMLDAEGDYLQPSERLKRFAGGAA